MKVYLASYAEGKDYVNNMNTLHNKVILYGGVDYSIKYTLNDLKMARYISRKYNQNEYIDYIYEKSSKLIKKLLLEKTNKNN